MHHAGGKWGSTLGVVIEPRDLADRIRAAYEGADLEAFGTVLAADARWGDDDHPNRCRSGADVLRTFAQWLDCGVAAEVLGVDSGPAGVFCRLHVNWIDPDDRPRGVNFTHVFMIGNGLITEIRRYNDPSSAAQAIGWG